MEAAVPVYANSPLLKLPEEVLQLVVRNVSNKYGLRLTCKTLSTSMAHACQSIVLSFERLRARGAVTEVNAALRAFPRADRFTVVMQDRRAALLVPDKDPEPWTYSCHEDLSPPSINLSAQDLLGQSLQAALQRRRLRSLALLDLSSPVPPLLLPPHLLSSIEELELSDTSYAVALEQGAVNLLLRRRDVISHGDAMIQLAASLPSLRRVSLTSAAFSAEAIASLSVLSHLESLRLVGCMECPGGVAQAAATHRTLLRGLQALRQLCLPLAVPSGTAAALAGAESDSSDDDDDGVDVCLRGSKAMGFSGRGRDGFFFSVGRLGDDEDNGMDCDANPDQQQQRQQARCHHGGRALGFPILPVLPDVRQKLQSGHGTTHAVSAGSVRNIIHASAWTGIGSVSTAAAFDGSAAPFTALECASESGGFFGLSAAAGPRACRGPRAEKWRSLSEGFAFPAHLTELTIPLCILNRPVFEAVCAAAAAVADGVGERSAMAVGAALAVPAPALDRAGAPSRISSAAWGISAGRLCGGCCSVTGFFSAGNAVSAGPRVPSADSVPTLPAEALPRHHIPKMALAPAAGASQPAPARAATLAAAPMPVSFWFGAQQFATLCAPGGPDSPLGSSALNGCELFPVRTARQADGDAVWSTGSTGAPNFSSTASAQPSRCSSSADCSIAGSCHRGQASSKMRSPQLRLRALHLPAAAGRSSWEGSFLTSLDDFQRLAGMQGLEVLHLSLDPCCFRMGKEGLQACLRTLGSLRALQELHIREAKPPAAFSIRKGFLTGNGSRDTRCFRNLFGPSAGLLPTDPSGLEQLQQQWPVLRSLHVLCETLVRSNGRLVVPRGPEDLPLLPPPCACCAGRQVRHTLPDDVQG